LHIPPPRAPAPIALEAKPDEITRRGHTEIDIQSALHNPKERLIRAAPTGLTALRPMSGASHGIADNLFLSRQGHAVIEGHHDIGPQGFFNLDGRFRRDEMR